MQWKERKLQAQQKNANKDKEKEKNKTEKDPTCVIFSKNRRFEDI